MEIKVKCKLVNVKQTPKGKIKCTFVTDTHDVISSYVDSINEEKAKRMAQMEDKTFSIADDTYFYYRDDNKTNVGESV